MGKMRAIVLLSLLAGAMAAPESRFLCSECVDEMHKLGHMVKMGAVYIHDYIRDTYCPTHGDHQHFCRESLSRYYVGMLYAIVEHYFVDGALHVCQTEESVRLPRSTPASASRDWSGLRRTSRTRL